MAATEDAVSPETPPTDRSPLMHKVPPEIRLKIFAMVLRATNGKITLGKTALHLGPGNWRFVPYPNKKLDVALLTVNRQIFKEAQEALYTTNYVWMDKVEDLACYDEHKQLRYVQFGENLTIRIIDEYQTFVENPLTYIIARQPKLRAVTMRAPDIGYSQAFRHFHDSNKDLLNVRCVDIGLFEIILFEPFDGKIWLEYESLRSTLLGAKALLQVHGMQELNRRMAAFEDPSGDEELETTFATWLTANELARESRADPDAYARRSNDETEVAMGFVNDITFLGPFFLPQDLKLMDVNPSEHDAETLGWATQHLNYGLDSARCLMPQFDALSEDGGFFTFDTSYDWGA